MLDNLLQRFLKGRLKNKDFKELLKGGFTALIVKVGGMLLGYIIMIIITNTYGTKIYGEYALGFTVLSIMVLLPKFGLDTALVRILGEVKQYGNKNLISSILMKAFFISISIGFLITILLFFFSDALVFNIFKKPDLQNEIRLIKWLIIPYSCLFLIATYFQAYKKIIHFMLFNATLLNAVFFILLISVKISKYNFQPFTIFSVSILIVFIIATIHLFRSVLKTKTVTNPSKKLEHYSFKKIVNISSPMLLSSSFVLLISWLDIIMLGIFTTEESVGIYNASLRLATISGIALFAVNAIATPKFIEFYSLKDYLGLKKTVRHSTKLIFYSTVPLLIIFILFPKTILSINGSEFKMGYLALTFLCLGQFFNSICGSVGFILQMTDNQKVFQTVLFLAAILNAVLNYILIPLYGYNGAAFASLLTVVSWNSALVFIVKKRLGFWTIYLPLLDKRTS